MTKEDKILRLLEVRGDKATFEQLFSQLLDMLLTARDGTPEEGASVKGVLVQHVTPAAVLPFLAEVYGRYFTEDDIDRLLAFHDTDFGRRFLGISLEMQGELRAVGQAWFASVSSEVEAEIERLFPDTPAG